MSYKSISKHFDIRTLSINIKVISSTFINIDQLSHQKTKQNMNDLTDNLMTCV